jgi:Right handed beta helix region
MRCFIRKCLAWVPILSLLLAKTPVVWAQSGFLTVEVGTPPPPPVPLVNHGDDWQFRKGTSEPPADWASLSDGSLDGTWSTGPGGFGYGDDAIVGEATRLTDMMGQYTTFYIRKSFEISSPVDANAHLLLKVDYDDGFVAYLDGAEIQRANTLSSTGTPIPYNATTGGNSHEASCCSSPNPATTYDLGAVGSRLSIGTHILAVHGINQAPTSSDFHLIVDLTLNGSDVGGALVSGVFSLVESSSVLLSGTNTISGSTRVVVNGEDASFNLASGTWLYTLSLAPGANRLFIAALDENDSILASTEQMVVYQTARVNIGGALAGNYEWGSGDGIYHVTNSLVIMAGGSLEINPGTVLLMAPGSSIRAGNDAALSILGVDGNEVLFLPGDGRSVWGELAADGANASLTMQHAETIAGAVKFRNGASGLMEDCYVHDYKSGTTPIAGCENAVSLTVRRCHFNVYHETLWRFTPIVVEDSLFENANNVNSDALDFDGAPPGAIIRRCTFRYGPESNTDAIDLGSQSLGTVVENCIMRDFPDDKGVSIGEDSFGIEINNCLMYHCDSGVAVKDNCTASIRDCTIAQCDYGFRNYNKANPSSPTGGGHITNSYNNILWDNVVPVSLLNGSTLVADHSDIANTNWPGEGNISLDPLFLDGAAFDFQLGTGSPCLGSGRDGIDMGVKFPFGGIPSRPFNLSSHSLATNSIELRWEEDADNETGFMIERSADGVSWQPLAVAAANATTFTDGDVGPEETYFYRARATNGSGPSRYSNMTKSTTQASPASETVVGGTLTENAVWTTNMGTILVLDDVVIPAGLSLTVQEGVLVKLTNGVSIRALAGGAINILGSEENKVILAPVNSGNWGELSANGTDSALTVRQADISGGSVSFLTGSVGLVEDSHIHDYFTPTPPILYAFHAQGVTIRRSHVANYHETLFRYTLMLIEDCLFEYMTDDSSDGIDFDFSPSGSVIRRCTIRNGPRTNTDAIDIGSNSQGVRIEDCLLYNVTDKGVSIGEDSFSIIVSNCLIYAADIGIAVKDSCTSESYQNTLTDCNFGFRLYRKTGVEGGHITNAFNNIIYGNTQDILLLDNATAVFETSLFGQIIYPGVGNIMADPLFMDANARDYRLSSNSPAYGAGAGGVNMGVVFPVGGLPDVPGDLQVLDFQGGQANLAWTDTSDNETGFVIELSLNSVDWVTAGTAPANAAGSVISGLTEGASYAFRIRGTNFIGESLNSNWALTSGTPGDMDGDGLPDQWETDHGLNPNDSSDAALDADQDAASNLEEYLAGTDPNDGASKLGFNSIVQMNANTVRLQFTALANRTYSVQFRDSLTSGDWANLIDVPVGASDRTYSVSDSLLPNIKSRFYRLVTP